MADQLFGSDQRREIAEAFAAAEDAASVASEHQRRWAAALGARR
jgi:hypothetical protein